MVISMLKKLGGKSDVRSCIMPGHLVQEINAGTVHCDHL